MLAIISAIFECFVLFRRLLLTVKCRYSKCTSIIISTANTLFHSEKQSGAKIVLPCIPRTWTFNATDNALPNYVGIGCWRYLKEFSLIMAHGWRTRPDLCSNGPLMSSSPHLSPLSQHYNSIVAILTLQHRSFVNCLPLLAVTRWQVTG